MNAFWNALLSYSCRTLVLLNLVNVTACSFECVRQQTADTEERALCEDTRDILGEEET
jgi:hypothetical protein